MASQRRTWSLDHRYPTDYARNQADRAVWGATGMRVGLDAEQTRGMSLRHLIRAWVQAYVAAGGAVRSTGWSK